jgi:hypothetical protein
MGGTDPRYNHGPSWDVARLFVDHCSPDGQWIPELARIAGLWARTNNATRPAGYDGPIFPAVIAPGPLGQLNALTKDFPKASQPPGRCPRHHDEHHGVSRRLLQGLKVLTMAAIPWVVALLLGFDVDWPNGPGASTAELGTIGLILASLAIVAFADARLPRWYVPMRPDFAVMVSSPPRVPHTQMILEMVHDTDSQQMSMKVTRPRVTHPIPEGAAPTRRSRRWHDTLTWSLAPGAVIITPLEPGRWFPQSLTGITACVNGFLAIATPTDADDGQPHVEWALVDDDGRLHATGILPPPSYGAGNVITAVVPEYGLRRVTYRELVDRPASPHENEPELQYLESSLDGVVFWPWRWSQINVVLRRLDTLPCTADVKWRNAGLHLHRTSRKALTTTTTDTPLRYFGAVATQHILVSSGSKLQAFARHAQSEGQTPGPLDRIAEPYEVRDELTLYQLDRPIEFICHRCARRQTSQLIAAESGEAVCESCFLASPFKGWPESTSDL